MSSKNYANSGHVVEVKELTKLLSLTNPLLKEWETAIDECDWEKCNEFLMEHLPEQYPCPDECFSLNDECESEDLELSVVYAFWDRDTLFETVKRKETILLEFMGIKPEFGQWVTFG